MKRRRALSDRGPQYDIIMESSGDRSGRQSIEIECVRHNSLMVTIRPAV